MGLRVRTATVLLRHCNALRLLCDYCTILLYVHRRHCDVQPPRHNSQAILMPTHIMSLGFAACSAWPFKQVYGWEGCENGERCNSVGAQGGSMSDDFAAKELQIVSAAHERIPKPWILCPPSVPPSTKRFALRVSTVTLVFFLLPLCHRACETMTLPKVSTESGFGAERVSNEFLSQRSQI